MGAALVTGEAGAAHNKSSTTNKQKTMKEIQKGTVEYKDSEDARFDYSGEVEVVEVLASSPDFDFPHILARVPGDSEISVFPLKCVVGGLR